MMGDTERETERDAWAKELVRVHFHKVTHKMLTPPFLINSFLSLFLGLNFGMYMFEKERERDLVLSLLSLSDGPSSLTPSPLHLLHVACQVFYHVYFPLQRN